MRKNLIVVMDPITEIDTRKDTTFAMLLEGQRRGYSVWYCEESDLSLGPDGLTASLRRLEVVDRQDDFFTLGDPLERPIGDEDLVLMRCDPPVDANYLYTTWLLDQAERDGALVVNRPSSLRDFNEKLAIAAFPQWMPPTEVSASKQRLKAFVQGRGKAILKPLDGMGGRGIFIAKADDPNLNVIVETLTEQGSRPAMAQAFLPAIADGDKRVLLINGEPVPYMLARVPGADDFRGNLARGGRGEGRPLDQAGLAIARAVGPVLRRHGVLFAGLDVIGDRLTEVNVTSPTCVRELDAQFGINICRDLFDVIDP